MALKGVTVLFDDMNLEERKNTIKAILNDPSTNIETIHIKNDTEIPGTTGIFKITFYGDNYEQVFKSNSPNVLLIKVFKGCSKIEVDNEITIHEKINSITNMEPLAPSILFYDIIKKETFKELELCTVKSQKNELFCQIITPEDENPEIITPEDEEPEDEKPTLVNMILVMEYIKCETYYKFLRVSKKVTSDTYNFKIRDISISLQLIELGIFFTYYLASVLAVNNYHHGDLHRENVMICSNQNPAPTIEDSPIKIHPFLIDFGRAGKIENAYLRLVTLKDEYLETLGLTILDKKVIKNEDTQDTLEPSYLVLQDIYLEALENESTIADYVKTLLTQGNYVDAVLTLSMCVNKIFPETAETENSQFTYYIEDILAETEGEPSVYAYLFEINEKMRTKFDTEIGKLIQTRKPVEQVAQVKPVGGGKLVLRRQKNSKTRRHIRSKIHKKKTRKLNKKKSRKLNKKKSRKLNKKKSKKTKTN